MFWKEKRELALEASYPTNIRESENQKKTIRFREWSLLDILAPLVGRLQKGLNRIRCKLPLSFRQSVQQAGLRYDDARSYAPTRRP